MIFFIIMIVLIIVMIVVIIVVIVMIVIINQGSAGIKYSYTVELPDSLNGKHRSNKFVALSAFVYLYICICICI